MVLSDSSSPDESISKAGESTPTTSTSHSSRKSQKEIKGEIRQQLEQRFKQDRQQRSAGGSRDNLNSNVEGAKMPSGPKPYPRTRKDEKDNHSYDGDDGGSGLCDCLANTIQMPVIIVAGIVVPVFAITFIIIGAVFINDCRIEPMIPVWLIVQGVIMLFGIGTGGFARRYSKSESSSFIIKILGIIISLLTAAWFIAGNVWVYQAWAQSPDYQHYWYTNGCDRSLYLVAFWGVIVLDVLFAVAAVVGVVAFLMRGCRFR